MAQQVQQFVKALSFCRSTFGPLLFVALGCNELAHRTAAFVSTMLFHRLPILSLRAMSKSGPFASMVTILAVIAIIPFFTLQLRAIALGAAVILEPTAGSIA